MRQVTAGTGQLIENLSVHVYWHAGESELFYRLTQRGQRLSHNDNIKETEATFGIKSSSNVQINVHVYMSCCTDMKPSLILTF
jgi:hypothetical protein